MCDSSQRSASVEYNSGQQDASNSPVPRARFSDHGDPTHLSGAITTKKCEDMDEVSYHTDAQFKSVELASSVLASYKPTTPVPGPVPSESSVESGTPSDSPSGTAVMSPPGKEERKVEEVPPVR